MPSHWTSRKYSESQARSRMTMKKLEMQRKQADLPHQSFDIDGDGTVSG